ncbi:hypothetical protein MBT84_48200 [Streptomyces sp. MBT84]|nr:hypothetical protein [Streptomyces sp. MBT84]
MVTNQAVSRKPAHTKWSTGGSTRHPRPPEEDDARRTVAGRGSDGLPHRSPRRYGERSYPRCAQPRCHSRAGSAQRTGPRPCPTRRPRPRTASSPRHAPGADPLPRCPAAPARTTRTSRSGHRTGRRRHLPHGETATMAGTLLRRRAHHAGTGVPMTATHAAPGTQRHAPAVSAVPCVPPRLAGRARCGSAPPTRRKFHLSDDISRISDFFRPPVLDHRPVTSTSPFTVHRSPVAPRGCHCPPVSRSSRRTAAGPRRTSCTAPRWSLTGPGPPPRPSAPPSSPC